MAAKVPISVCISYEVLRDWMKLPADVELLGIPGVHDTGGAFTVILETPVHHIKGANLQAQYVTNDDGVKFSGFA